MSSDRNLERARRLLANGDDDLVAAKQRAVVGQTMQRVSAGFGECRVNDDLAVSRHLGRGPQRSPRRVCTRACVLPGLDLRRIESDLPRAAIDKPREMQADVLANGYARRRLHRAILTLGGVAAATRDSPRISSRTAIRDSRRAATRSTLRNAVISDDRGE